MKLPFLKSSRWPRIGKPQDEKTINASFEEKLQDHLFDELMRAVEMKNTGAFRNAIQALVLNCFEEATDA